MQLRFHASIPAGARNRLTAHLAQRNNSPERAAAITRLAEYPAMANAWPNLPDDPPGTQAKLIDWILAAFDMAAALKPPLPRKRADILGYLERYRIVEPSLDGAATMIECARNDIEQFEPTLRAYWDPSKFDPPLTFDQFVGVLSAAPHALEFVKRQSEANVLQLLRDVPLPPPPRKRGSTSARETYFSKTLSAVVMKLYFAPKDGAVADITAVVFDLPNAVSTDTARSRRRSAKRHREG